MPRSDFVIHGKPAARHLMIRSAWRRRVHAWLHGDFALALRHTLASISSCAPTIGWAPGLVAFFLLSSALAGSAVAVPEAWVPLRWTGGPLEVAWRTRAKTLPADAVVRDALARWYEPGTLNLLEGSAANCLLVTWSAPAEAAVEAEQHRLVKIYTEAAHKRGLAVLGLVYAPGDASKMAADAVRAGLDGLVLEGDFTPDFSAALGKAAGSMVIIEISKDAAAWRWKAATIIAVAGVAASGRNLSELGIRGAPSSQPWIESNLWLARSFDLTSPSRPVWISSRRENTSAVDYARDVADAAAAGGRWIVTLDDALRAQLRARDAAALETWRRLSTYMKFAEDHAAWRALAPYGNVGILLDPASTKPDLTEEYLQLAARRQVPYQLVRRSGLNAAAVAKFRAIVALELDPPSAAERSLLQEFAENGGLVIAAPSWGGAPKTEPFAEIPAGKGRVIVYRDPDPESVARDLRELLSDEEMGVVPFNVPSVITSASGGAPGQPLLVQLVNYFDHPVEAITLRVAGRFRSARLESPDGAALDLPLRQADGSTEVTIPKLLLWSAVSMQEEETTQ
ncbi:MAG TPA: hypothetical protein VFA67_00480 [Candidatus Sulfotelmatobacter sp.]|nr:hypothetical protein [Candidatus Sulfotelmatobacter sp.]